MALTNNLWNRDINIRYDGLQGAVKHGAKSHKQWVAILDGRTRSDHRRLDGQIVEVDKPFELGTKKAMYPGDFGDPAEDCNCRCRSLGIAEWELTEKELDRLKKRAEYFGLDKTKDFEDFKQKYIETLENTGKNDIIDEKIASFRSELHTAVSSGSWCGGQRQQCGDSGSGLR